MQITLPRVGLDCKAASSLIMFYSPDRCAKRICVCRQAAIMLCKSASEEGQAHQDCQPTTLPCYLSACGSRRQAAALACAQGVPTSVQQPGSWSAAPRLPHLPLSLSQSIGADTPQRASLHRPGQQPRLVTATRYPSVFSRPPVPRSQSPLRRLAERSAERTGSQLLPSQDEPQVCSSGTITVGADACVTQVLQLYAGALLTTSLSVLTICMQEVPVCLSQPNPGVQYAQLASVRGCLPQRPAAMYVTSPPAMQLATESQPALSTQDPCMSSQHPAATPVQPGPAAGSFQSLQGMAGGASATATKLLDQIARMSSCEDAMDRVTSRLAGVEEVCSRVEAAMAGLHALVGKQAAATPPPAAVKLCEQATQTAAIPRQGSRHNAGTQTSLPVMPEGPANRSSPPWQSAASLSGAGREEVLFARSSWPQGPAASASKRTEAVQQAPLGMRPCIAAPSYAVACCPQRTGSHNEQPASRGPARAGGLEARAPAAKPQPGPWRRKASADPVLRAAAAPATAPCNSSSAGAPAARPAAGDGGAQHGAQPSGNCARLPPGNAVSARPLPLQGAAQVCGLTWGQRILLAAASDQAECQAQGTEQLHARCAC